MRTLPTPVMDRLRSEEIRALYHDKGMTQAEVAAFLGVASRTITRAMRKFGIPARRLGPRASQKGDKNPHWIGSRARYNALHRRVEALYGYPKKCTRCGTEDPAQGYDWANLTGHYEDVSDYARMCRPCHRGFDDERRRAAGIWPPIPLCATCGRRLPMGSRREARKRGIGYCKPCFVKGVKNGTLGRWAKHRRTHSDEQEIARAS